MDVHVSLKGRGDLSARIYRQLLDAVLDGRLRAGERLPPTRELAVRLDVSRNTVTVAYERLAAEGVLSGRIGAGTFVSTEPLSSTQARRAPPGAVRPRRLWESLSTPSDVAPVSNAYDFRVGIPDAQLFPLATWRRLIARELRPAAVRSAAYGESSGHAGLRAAIARYVGISRSVRAGADDVIVTHGAQQALDLIGRVLIAPGNCVAVEEPGYAPVGGSSRLWVRRSSACTSTAKVWTYRPSRGRRASSTSRRLTSFRSACRCLCTDVPRCSRGRNGTARW